MKKLFVVLSLALLASCGDKPHESLKQTRDDPNFTVEWVMVDDGKIVQTCSDLGVKYEANGCNAFYPAQKKCVIYVMKQRFAEDTQRLAIIGHELWHCRYGEWHD